MLNVHSVVLTFLLATCAALTGSLPSVAFMAYMLLLRTPDGPVVKWALWSLIAVHAVLPLVSLLLNLAATTDDDIKAKMFHNETTTFNAMRIAGIYSATAGSDLKFAASIVPEVLTALFAFIARRPLSQRPRPGAARNATQKYSIYWALLLWATMCGAAALFVCSVVGGIFYVFAVVISSAMVFIGTEFTSHTTVTTLGVIGTIVGTLVISVWGVVQNYGAWQYFDGAFSDTVGLKVFCNFVELKDGRCIVQFYLGLIATVCAHVMTHIAVYIGDAKPRGGGAKPLSQSTKQAGRAPHHQHSQQSQQLPLSQRLLENTATRLSATNTGPATATAAEDAMSSKGSIKSSLFLGTADVVAAIMRLFRFLATWIMMNFIVLPLFPLMCLVADLIIFPTIPTLALLPLVFCGLLKPSLMHAVMPYHIALMALLFMSQYFIFASADRGVSTLTKLFLRETTTGWQLLEIGINLAAYAVLLATYEQQKRFGSKGARRERKQKALEHQRKEEAHLMKECVEHRLQVATITTTPTPTPANRPRSDSMRSDTFSTRGSNAITMTSATRESAVRFIQQQEEREEQHRSQSRLGMGDQHASSFEVEIEDDETLIERSVVLLGEERVRRIQQLLSERPGSTRDTQCFHRLTGRLPTDEELQALRRSSAMEVGSNPNLLHDGEIVTGPPEDPIRCILRRRRVQAALPMWRQLIHDLSILINHYSLNLTILFTFVAGSCVQEMDVIHAIVLALFVTYYLFSNFARRSWWFLVCYISALTLFEVIFTFVNRFLDTNGEEYLAPGIHAHTIGLVEMPSRWTAICYFTVLFFVCGQYHLLKVSSISWDELFTLFEWQRLISVPAVRLIRQRLTLAVAAAVFISLGIFERRSLIVQFFLVFFLVICIFTAGLPKVSLFGGCFQLGGEASPKLLWKLWLAASIYSGLVMLFVSLYQFRDIATRVNEGLRSIKGCDVNVTIADTTTCQQEIGIVAPSGYVLTYFLAPWFIALVTAVAHMSSVSRTAAAAARDEERQRHRQENNLSQRHISGPTTSTAKPAATSETSRLLMTRAGSAGTPAEMLPLKNTDQDNDDDVSYALDGSDEGGVADDPTGMLAAARRFAAPDQLMFHFIVWAVNGIEVLSDILAWIGHEYGALLVWGALYIAATTEYTLMAAVYAVFLVFDWSSVASLIYCVLHLTALYAYQFSFTPTINVVSGSVNWAELIGLIKNDSPEMNAVGPVLVFFAVLYRFKTSSTPAFTSSIGVAASAPSASTTGNVLMHAKVKAWLSFFHHQGFHLIGYEMLVMFSLLNVQESIHNACGSLAGIILVILMWAGRSQFFNSRLLSFVLRVLFFFLCAMQLLVRLNAAHNMWTVPPTLVYKYFAWERTSPTSQWEHWAGTGSVLGMFYSFASMVVLHMLRNKQAQTQAHYNNVNHTNDDNNNERVELWVQRNLYFDARSFTWYLSDLFSDPDKNIVLLADGLNQRQPAKKREGNVLRNLSTEKLNHYVPEIPNTLDVNTGLPIVQRAAGSPQQQQQQQQTQQSPPKPGSDLHSQPTSTPISSNLGRRGGNAGDINGSVMDLRRLNNSNSSATPPTSHFTCISPPPRHLLFYDALMTFVVRANSFLSPVAIFSFAAGTMLPSILCTLLMVAGMMQFAYRDQLNWKFYRLWPKILLTYIAALIVMPMAMNVPVVGNWATDKMNNIASIIGLLENGVPTGISGMRAALLFMIAFQTRIYEEFWFERMIRAMRSDLEKRCHKHTELMRHISDTQRKDVENADVRDKQLRDRLRRVREMYGGIQFETASPGDACGGEDDLLLPAAAAAAVATAVNNASVVASPSFVRGSFYGGGGATRASPTGASGGRTKIVDETTFVPKEPISSGAPPAQDPLAVSSAELATSQRASALPRLSLRESLIAALNPMAESDDRENEGSNPTAAVAKSHHGKDDSPPEAYQPSRYERVQELCLNITDVMLDYTFNPSKRRRELLEQGKYHPLLCPWIAAVRVSERHTAQLVALLTVGNVIQSGTAWDSVPAFLVMTVISVYDPFAPLETYEALRQFIVVGILIKAVILVLIAHTYIGDGVVTFFNWFMITGDGTTKLGAVDLSSTDGGSNISAYGDLIFDFFAFVMIVIHQNVSFANGVYSEDERVNSAATTGVSLFNRMLDGISGGAGQQNNKEKQHDQYEEVHDAEQRHQGAAYNDVDEDEDDEHTDRQDHETKYLIQVQPVDGHHSDDEEEERRNHGTTTEDVDGYATIPQDSPRAAGAYGDDDDDAENRAGHSSTGGGAEGDGVVSSSSAAAAVPSPPQPKTVKEIVVEFIDNATSTRGTGYDLYTSYFVMELIALVILTLNYYSIAASTNGTNGSIVQNVQDNMLPGAFVIALICSLIVMLIDRMLYAANFMWGKLIFHVVYSTTLFILFCLWINILDPQKRAAGTAYFCFKCFYMYLSCWQLRWGFPYHRRHDPFTHKPDDLLPWLGYQIFRGIPFLWELRVVADWTVTHTALRMECYLKVENVYATVYERFVSIGDAHGDQPHFGGPIRVMAKITRGLVRVVIILFAVTFPLLYYSTFNPAMGQNDVTQVGVSVSFESSAPFFASSLLSTAAVNSDYPQLASWLSLTRPLLGSFGITESQKRVQLMDLSSCSNNLWTISPQGLRVLSTELNATYYNESKLMLNLELSLTRGGTASSTTDSTSSTDGASTGSSDEETLRHPWPLPWNTAGEILDAIQNASTTTTVVNDSAVIMLPNFYSPFIFNQPTTVRFFPALSGASNVDDMRCSIVLRSEVDPLTQARVRYWCLKCDSLFLDGMNQPTSSSPEWSCLTNGGDCNPYDFEASTTIKPYSATPMYYVFFSDPIPNAFSFLPNVGILAIYSTFVLALGRVFRSMFSTSAANIVQTDMADPTPVAHLIEYIAIARAYNDLILEQSVYYELIDLLRSPERLLHVTGLHKKQYRSVDTADSTQ